MIKRKCLICNKTFYTYPSRVKIGIAKYCSRECYSEIRNKELIKMGKKFRYQRGHIPIYKLHPEIALRGENHPLWKGKRVGYRGLHYWVHRQKGNPEICEICGTTSNEKELDWANIDHKYRRNSDDFISLCKSCHKNYDLSHKLTQRRF